MPITLGDVLLISKQINRGNIIFSMACCCGILLINALFSVHTFRLCRRQNSTDMSTRQKIFVGDTRQPLLCWLTCLRHNKCRRQKFLSERHIGPILSNAGDNPPWRLTPGEKKTQTVTPRR